MLIAILAAGQATRFGGDKMMSPCAGKPLGQWTLEAACGTGHPICWVGGGTKPAFLGTQCRFLFNSGAAGGLSRSIGIAVAEAARLRMDALMILLGDMPLVTADLIEELIHAGPYSACAYHDSRPGVPAVFPSSMFGRLAKLSGDRGAASLLGEEPRPTLVIPPVQSLIDVDTPADIAAAEEALRARAFIPPAA